MYVLCYTYGEIEILFFFLLYSERPLKLPSFRFYQNHRKYATSRSDQQLRGYPRYQDDNCEPYQIDPNTTLPYAPCGLIANTMFNGQFNTMFNGQWSV